MKRCMLVMLVMLAGGCGPGPLPEQTDAGLEGVACPGKPWCDSYGTDLGRQCCCDSISGDHFLDGGWCI